MYNRKSFDEKKHPFRDKNSRNPKPHRKDRGKAFLKDTDEDIYKYNTTEKTDG